jgi:hypothetical protein
VIAKSLIDYSLTGASTPDFGSKVGGKRMHVQGKSIAYSNEAPPQTDEMYGGVSAIGVSA